MNPRPLCLVIDDEPALRELSVLTLTPLGIDCHTAENVSEARQYLQQHTYDLCLTDMRLPDGNGLDLVSFIQQHHPNTPVAVITAYGSVETAVQALKVGAFDFITKPINVSEFRALVITALNLLENCETTLNNLLGNSPAMQKLRTKIQKLARSQAPVYIKGESGVGKEVVARMIHGLGGRADKPFIPVNCGAVPTELMESEFFGHKKGSFTGALTDKVGLFRAAQGGTLFLDEVADLPKHMQVKLLRAIQEKQIRPIGAQKEEPVDVRILSATHKDLAELVRTNEFRQDLFYRINVIELQIPPLRERVEDVPLLVQHFLDRYHTSNGVVPAISAAAVATLQQYTFPGNVRELENILERAAALCENDVIEPDDFQLPEEYINSCLTEHATTSTRDGYNFTEFKNPALDPLLEDLEREQILSALEKANGSKKQAAKLLGITFGALRYRMQKFKVS